MEKKLIRNFSDDDIRKMGVMELAYIGDGVYELVVREYLLFIGIRNIKELNQRAVSYVSAPAQAKCARLVLEQFSDDERGVFIRGRNRSSTNIPKNASKSDYNYATGLECVFGYLYLKKKTDRISKIMEKIIEYND